MIKSTTSTNRHLKNFNFNAVGEKAKTPSGRLEPATLRAKQDLWLHLQAMFRDFVFPEEGQMLVSLDVSSWSTLVPAKCA